MEDKNETVLWMPNGTQVKLVVDQSVIFSVFKKKKFSDLSCVRRTLFARLSICVLSCLTSPCL